MASWFRTDPKEQARQNDRDLRKAGREIERDRRDLDRQEAQLTADIKAAAKRNDKATVNILAKRLVQLRNQRTKTYAMNAQINGVRAQAKNMQSAQRMAGVMGTTSKTMANVNKQMNPQKVAATMRDFEKANTHMEMSEEMMNDALDAIFDEEGDEAESDAIVGQVLDEIGIEMGAQLSKAPKAPASAIGTSAGRSKDSVKADAELEAMLAKLKD